MSIPQRSLSRAVAALALASCAASACTDDLVSPPEEGLATRAEAPALQAAATPVTTFTCTRSWASATDGDWSDAAMWSPVGVPTAADRVCIEVAGTYSVTLDQDGSVSQLRLGGPSANATLDAVNDLHIGYGLVVEPGGELMVDPTNRTLELGAPWDPSATSGPAWFVNRGYVEVSEGCTCVPVARWSFQEYVNEGWLILAGPMDVGVIGRGSPHLGAGRDFTNRAFLLTHGADTVRVFGTGPGPTYEAGQFTLEEGSVAGSVPLLVTDFWEAIWSGGTISGPPGVALVVADRRLVLADDDMAGMIEVRDPANLEGEIGPDVHLRLRTQGYGWGHLREATWPAPPGTGFVNAGVLEVVLEPAGDFELSVLDPFTNQGEVRVTGEGEFHLRPFYSGVGVLNAGAVVVESDASLRIGPYGLTLLPRSTMSGTVVLDGVTVTGSGALGDVISEGARLAPGLVGSAKSLPNLAYGTLTATSLTLDDASTLAMHVGGAGAKRRDRVVVAGAVTYDGTLEVQTVAPFRGGLCGQVVPLLTHGPGMSLGAFARLDGVELDPSRAWRPSYGPDELALAGYPPGPEPLHLAPPALATREGAPTATVRLCMGETAPTSDVTVSFTSATGQVIAPGAVTFPINQWALPASVLVTTVDDGVAEGVHGDTILLSAATGDPFYGSAALPSLAITITDNEVAADLEIIKLSQEDNQYVGDTLDTVFRVTNLGPDPSTAATVVSTSVGGLDFLYADGASCTVDGAGAVTCVTGVIPAGGQVDITVSFEGALVGTHVSTWTVSGPEPDPNAVNNSTTYSQRVN